ncbi:hypothetical protein ACHAW6_000512 [Cyclotella cf. meneghiniana]
MVQQPQHDHLNIHAYVDSDWATCTKTRRSFSGIIVQLAGGMIAYKTKLQPAVALSSMEAEFIAACDATKMILFTWTTVLYEDNDACTAMANARKPTRQKRHIDIRCFVLAEWVEHDNKILECIHTSINMANHMTKILDRTILYCHVEYIM